MILIRLCLIVGLMFISFFTYAERSDFVVPVPDVYREYELKEHISAKDDVDNISFSYYRNDGFDWIPIINNEVTFFVQKRKPVFIWIDADNDPSTQIFNSRLSKGAEIIFSTVNDIEGSIYYNGKIYQDGQHGVKILASDNYSYYDVSIPKELVSDYWYYLQNPKVWFAFEPENKGNSSTSASNFNRKIKMMKSQSSIIRLAPKSQSYMSNNFFNIPSENLASYAELAEIEHAISDADLNFDEGGVIGVGVGAEGAIGGVSLGIYEDEIGYGVYSDLQMGPSGVAIQGEGFYSPTGTIEDVAGWSYTVSAGHLSTGVPLENGLLGYGHTINADFTIWGLDLPIPGIVNVHYLFASRYLYEKQQEEINSDGNEGSDFGNDWSSDNDSWGHDDDHGPSYGGNDDHDWSHDDDDNAGYFG